MMPPPFTTTCTSTRTAALLPADGQTRPPRKGRQCRLLQTGEIWRVLRIARTYILCSFPVGVRGAVWTLQGWPVRCNLVDSSACSSGGGSSGNTTPRGPTSVNSSLLMSSSTSVWDVSQSPIHTREGDRILSPVDVEEYRRIVGMLSVLPQGILWWERDDPSPQRRRKGTGHGNVTNCISGCASGPSHRDSSCPRRVQENGLACGCSCPGSV